MPSRYYREGEVAAAAYEGHFCAVDLLARWNVWGGTSEDMTRLMPAAIAGDNEAAHRFYGGLTAKHSAEVLGVSVGTVERDWRLARAKLHFDMTNTPD